MLSRHSILSRTACFAGTAYLAGTACLTGTAYSAGTACHMSKFDCSAAA